MSGIGNIKQTKSDYWSLYNPDVINTWKLIALNQNITLDEMNNFITSHYNLYKNSQYDGSKAQKYDGVKQYQQDYHNKYGFGNTDNFWRGYEHDYTGSSLNTGDIRNQSGLLFVGDDYYGGLTHNRRATYFSDEELAQANEAVKSRGWEFVKADFDYGDSEGRHAYILREKPASTPTLKPEPEPDPNPDPDQDSTPKPGSIPTFTNRKYIPKYGEFKRSPWLNAIPFAMDAGLGIMDSIYRSNQEKKKKFPLKSFAPERAIITDAYNYRQQMEQAANELYSKATQNLGSDLTQNMRRIHDAAQQALDFKRQATLEGSKEFNQTSQNAVLVANRNLKGYNDVANENRAANAAAWNNIILANQKRSAETTAEMQNFIDRSTRDFGEKLKTDRMNYVNWLKGKYAFDSQIHMDRLYLNYLDATSDITKSPAYRTFVAAVNNGQIEGLEFDGTPTDEQMKEWFLTHEGAAPYRKQYEEWIKQLQDNYRIAAGNENLAYLAMQGRIPSYVTNHGISLYTYAKGGSLLSRLADYANYTLRELNSVRKHAEYANKSILKKLKRELDNIDKETLLLLRQVFK